jgi:hypothetical protein
MTYPAGSISQKWPRELNYDTGRVAVRRTHRQAGAAAKAGISERSAAESTR